MPAPDVFVMNGMLYVPFLHHASGNHAMRFLRIAPAYPGQQFAAHRRSQPAGRHSCSPCMELLNPVDDGGGYGGGPDFTSFSPAVESIGARLRGRGAMRTANVPISLKQNGEPISRKQDVVMVDQAPYDGLLGWECIRKYVWNINYPKRSHRFSINCLPEYGPGTSWP